MKLQLFLYIVALKGTPLSVNDYETVFSISSTTRALKNYCIYICFFQCCVVLHFHTTLLSHAWLHPLFYQWLCVGPSQPGIDEWLSLWKQSPADLRSKSHCSVDKLETWQLVKHSFTSYTTINITIHTIKCYKFLWLHVSVALCDHHQANFNRSCAFIVLAIWDPIKWQHNGMASIKFIAEL